MVMTGDVLSIINSIPISVLLIPVVLVLLSVALWIMSPLMTFWWMQMTPNHSSEAFFVDFDTPGGKKPFPSLDMPPTVDISIVIPAYNEQARLPRMLDEAIHYLTQRSTKVSTDNQFSFELIIVDDGSKDGTVRIAHEYTKRHGSDKVRLLQLSKNHGKGGAVNKGVMRARGRYILMADADGATLFSDLERLEQGMLVAETQADGGIVVGSRAHLEQESLAKRSMLRTILMHGFHTIVSVLCVPGVHDTQCGFKLFSRRAAQRLFPNQHIQRWAFDAELLYIASKLSIPVKEEAVNWTEVDGSKLSVASATLQMLRDLVLIRLCYTIGIWTIVDSVSASLDSPSGLKKVK